MSEETVENKDGEIKETVITIKKWNKIEVNETKTELSAFLCEGSLVKYFALIDNKFRIAIKIPKGSELTAEEITAAVTELKVMAMGHLNIK